MRKKNYGHRCQRCNEFLNPRKIKWLELSQTDGNYYKALPEGHISQGAFAFGTACAKTQIKEQEIMKLSDNTPKPNYEQPLNEMMTMMEDLHSWGYIK